MIWGATVARIDWPDKRMCNPVIAPCASSPAVNLHWVTGW
jgi:hypothetical protein